MGFEKIILADNHGQIHGEKNILKHICGIEID